MLKSLKLLSCALLFQSVSAFADCPTECDLTHRWWLNLGVGVGSTFNNTYAPINTAGAFQLSFNGMLGSNLFMTLEQTHLGHNGDEAHELGLLLGYKDKHTHWYWSAAAGIAYYKLEREFLYYGPYWYGNYSTEKTGVGIPVEGQLFWTPFKHFGLGLIAHGVASKDPIGAVLFGIQVS